MLALSAAWSWGVVLLLAVVGVLWALALVDRWAEEDLDTMRHGVADADAGLEDELEKIRVRTGTSGPSWSEPGAEPVELPVGQIPESAIGYVGIMRERREIPSSYVSTLEERVEIAKRIVAELTRRLEVHHREIGVDPSRNGCHVCRPGGSLDLWDNDR
jgi:hypothetical protein